MSERLCDDFGGSGHIVLTSSEMITDTGHSQIMTHSVCCARVSNCQIQKYPRIGKIDKDDHVATISSNVECLMMEQSYKTVMIRIKSSVQSSHRLQST